MNCKQFYSIAIRNVKNRKKYKSEKKVNLYI